MLLNYLKLAIRLLIRSPFFTFINVLGLSMGFAVFLILWQHSSYELKSDQFHKDHERIFRLYSDFYHNTGVDWAHYLFGALPPVFTSIAREKFSEIETTTRIIHQNNFDEVRWAGPQTDTAGWSELSTKISFSFIGNGSEKYSFIETKTAYADPNLFEFFSIPLILGRPDKVLNNPDAIVLSSSTALKYFGKDDPIGKVVTLNDKESFTVTGVFQDLPDNSHLNFELVLSTLHIQRAIENVNPFQQSAQNYFKIREGVPLDELENKLSQEHNVHWEFKEWPGSSLVVVLQPLKDVPFRVFDNDVFSPKSKYLHHAFHVVAIIVLIMAWINYLNLKLSKQAARMKELATRKTVGATKYDFIKQFLIESLVINGMSLMLALTFIQILKYPLETLYQFYLPGWNEIDLTSSIAFALMVLPGILIAGLHPAFSVWRMATNTILANRQISRQKISFVEVSTVVQFVIAMSLIVWLFSVSTQVDFLTNDDWGLDREQVAVVDLPVMQEKNFSTEINSLKNALLSTAGVEDVTWSTTVAGDLLENRLGFSRTDTTGSWTVPKSDGGVDERFIPFYDLKLIAGRNFLPENPADMRSVILSRLAAKSVGYDPEQAVGKIVRVEKYSWRPFGTHAQIIGVIEDHRYNPLYLESGIANANRGTILTYGDNLFSKSKPLKMSIRIKSEEMGEVINSIERKYQEIFPGQIFHWYFLDHHMNAHYKNENIARNQILLFTCIAIGIACLGLLGMISNKVVQKTKEIGIRKVLGAELHQIAQILLNTTIKQTIISTAIGIPVAFSLTQQYLEKFSEHISLQWWHFTLPIGILMVILFVTIASVLWKATRTNPVDSLRYE